MMRNVTLIIFCFIATSIYSQKVFDYNFYLNGTIGFGIPINNTNGTFNNSNLNYSGSFFDKGSTYIKLKDKFGLHLNIIGIGYWYDIPNETILSENPDYFLWGKDYSYGNVKLAIYSGLAYKFNYRRFVIIPYFDLGFIPHTNSSIDSYLLKEQGSNNIRQINNSSKIQYNKFDYTFGTDCYFHFGKHWGFATTVQYDRFSASTDFVTTTKDYYSTDLKQTDKMKFDHKNVLVSFGFFLSFFDNNKTDIQ